MVFRKVSGDGPCANQKQSDDSKEELVLRRVRNLLACNGRGDSAAGRQPGAGPDWRVAGGQASRAHQNSGLRWTLVGRRFVGSTTGDRQQQSRSESTLAPDAWDA